MLIDTFTLSSGKVLHPAGGRGGGGFSKEICGTAPPASMTSRLASVTFKMASKVFFEETDKNLDFIKEILLRFLGFGDFKVSIVIEIKFDGELGDQQSSTLERNDMKLGPFN